MAITAPDGSWRYYGPPRTGSTVLHRLLQRPPVLGEYSGQQHDFEFLPGARLIVSVRNPFTRVVSLWKHKRYDLGRTAGEFVTHPHPVSDIEYPFRRFLEDQPSLSDFFSLSICQWISGLGEHAPLETVRQERFWDECVKTWPVLVHRGPPTDRPNSSDMAISAVSPYADDECARIVRDRYADDFERFGYLDTPPVELCR